MLKKILNRLKEPSTYAGLSGLVIMFGISIDQYQLYANAIAALAALASMILSEKTKEGKK